MICPHVMVDIETLGSHPTAPCVQLGAVAFDFESGYVSEPVRFNILPDLPRFTPDWDTLCWWSDQDEQARKSVFQKGTTFTTAWMWFGEWLNQHARPSQDFCVWAMPPEFDLAILHHHIDVYDMTPLWKYNATRDLRTLEWMAGGNKATRFAPTVPHDAGHDAHAQALTAIHYHQRLRGKQ